MSQSRTFAVAKDTVRRKKSDSLQGCGLSKHLYVGMGDAGYRYASFIKFTLDWTDVGRIVSATLNLYTDEYNSIGTAGEPGIFSAPAAADKPKVSVYRLTENFTEGDNADGQFDNSDYVDPSRTSSGAVYGKTMTPTGANVLHTIDITEIVRAWAPSTVEGGGRAANHGIGLYGTDDPKEQWSGWAREHAGGGGAAERPSITLTYELGATKPNVPSSMTPSGNVATLAAFEGNFSDVRPTDKLQSTDIEIYDAAKAATAATDDLITMDSGVKHGLVAGDLVYFTSVGATNLTAFTGYFVVGAGLTSTAFKVSATRGGAVFDITSGDAVQWSRLVDELSETASETERTNARFSIAKPVTLAIFATRTYRWRARVKDQEQQVSNWSGLVSFVLTNTAPSAPTLTPASGSSFDNLNLVKFSGGAFSDPDAGDTLRAHQIQLSPFPQGNIGWDEGDGILWDTGKVYAPVDATSWEDSYGGQALSAGTYYWRARQWDSKDGVSNWTYASIVLTDNFDPDPGTAYDRVQVNPQAPWRILIRNLLQADGVTPTTGRGPGQLIAVLEEAKNVGASIVYNSPGELHFTLLKDDPQLGVIEPKQVHYAVEFYSGDGWQEKFAGVIWDVDATDVDAVFKGIDYLALYDTVIDERYDPLKPNKSYASGGSFYSDVTIRTVVMDQLNRAKNLANSWVGFISIGAVATMDEKVTVYSTMQPVLAFVAGLIDSHRQGTGKRTRMKVVKATGGGYQLQIVDDPGVIRSDLAMYYGELAQGYRVIIFGDNWANVQHVIGRNRDGVKVVYKTIENQTFQPSQSVYGRIATVAVMDGVQDQNDLTRRGLQAAIQSAKLGKQIAIGIRTEHLAPLQGYDVCDVFPLKIVDGAIDTDRFGSGYWANMAVAWEATDIGQQSLVLTFMPREDSVAPDADLIPSQPMSTQPEWQLGWVPPDPLTSTSAYWYDIATGITYQRNGDGTYTRMDNDPRNNNQLTNSGFEMNPIATLQSKVWTVAADWGTATSAVNLATGGAALAMTTATY